MNKETSEMEKRDALRQSNREANALTRECIESATLLLMENSPLDKISITQIVERAGVSRASFYRNYGTKEAVLASRIDGLIEDMSDALVEFDAATQGEQAWERLLELVATNAHEYRLMLGAGMGGIILQRYIAIMNRNNPEADPALAVADAYYAGAIFAVLAEWVRADMKIRPSLVARTCNALMLEGPKMMPPCKPSRGH